MIYPDNFERKIGFTEIRTLLKGRCMSTLGTEWVDNRLKFLTDGEKVRGALARAEEFALFMIETDDELENEFFDVREPLLRVKPERTYMEELDLFSLRRSLQTVVSYRQAFVQVTDNAEESDAPLDAEANDAASKEAENNAQKEAEEAVHNFRYPALGTLALDVPTFPQTVRRIDGVLNKYGKMKDTASPELLSIRHQIEVTTRSISHSLRSIISEAQTEGYIDRDVAPTLRDGRLVIPVAPALKRKIRGIVHDESASGKTVFIEPAAVVDANNKIRELRAAERREVIRILQEISAEIRPHIQEMLSSLHFLAQVDFLRAQTAFSEQYRCTVPQVDNKPRMDWVQARHPLLEQSLTKHGGKIVPLDVSLREGQHILLISGPNAGGKSVCLKTVGLLQYMLQCGMPVPTGDGTHAGIFSDIMMDMGDEQSLENDLSTYSSHLLNMKQMMRSAGRASLLLIDEFGGGTEPQIGGALAEGILNRFVKNRNWGIITTHYQNLKHYAESHQSVANGAMLYDRQQMQPLFMLQVGHPGSSFALEIARKTGIPEDVIQYATDIVGKDYVMSDKYLQDIIRDRTYWENKRRNIRQREKQLEEAVERLEKESATLRQERTAMLSDAREKAKRIVEESNAKVENTIRAIKEAQAEKERTREARQELADFHEQLDRAPEGQDAVDRKLAKIMRRQQRRNEDPRSGREKHNEQQASAASAIARGANISASSNSKSATRPSQTEVLKEGSYVRLKGQTSVGRIETLTGKTARVLFGALYSNVNISRLESTEKPASQAPSEKVYTTLSRQTRDAMYEKKLHFSPEQDIRGMHVDEALQAVALFIDDAIQLEQSRVRILHGTGTGALRELVRNYLRTVPGVGSFRDEHVQFGGAGITVVELD